VNSPKLAELADDSERQFQSALGPAFQVVSCEVLGESHYRGGFRLVLSDGSRSFVVAYGDLELEVTLNGRELFGPQFHRGFEGIMFSREHLKQYLPGIVASSLAQMQVAG
jgi:hypothetical protein